MAYARIDYGCETPESIDRYGTEQTYRVFGVNGGETVLHTVTPVRDDTVLGRLGLRIMAWMHLRHAGVSTYHLDIHGRKLEIRHHGDGRIKLTLDGKQAYFEKKKYHWTGSVQAPEIIIEGPENLTPVPPKPTRQVRPQSSMTYKEIQELLQKGLPNDHH